MPRSHSRSSIVAIGAALLVLMASVAIGVAFFDWRAQVDRTVEDAERNFRPAPSEPGKPVALWIGDSFTAGTGADRTQSRYATQVCVALEWTCNVDGISGTAYTDLTAKRPTQAIEARLEEADRRWLADVVIIDLGRNDGAVPPEQLRESVRNTFATVSRLWPTSRYVVLAPWFLTATVLDFEPRLAVLDASREFSEFTVIDPNLSDWITDPRTGEWMLPKDAPHFDQRGHDFVASRLADMFRQAGVTDVPVVDTLG